MTLYKWSQMRDDDATVDSTINWAEGQSPSSVNDSARAMMAATAKYRDDISGAIATGGTSTAYTIASYQVFDTLVHMNDAMIAFTPHATNGATVTLNVDSLGAKPLRPSPGVELQSNVLIAGTPYCATYNNSDAVWYLQGFYGNPYNVPLGAGMDYWGPTAPNSAFAFPAGQLLSRSAYAALFSLIGTTYGPGDGLTNFPLPDKTGRVSAMKEASALLLTSTYFGGNSTGLGAIGGGEASTLLTANLPPYTPVGSISGTVTVPNNQSIFAIGNGANGSFTAWGNIANQGVVNTNPFFSGSFAGSAQGGTSAPVRTVQPTIVCNYILRII